MFPGIDGQKEEEEEQKLEEKEELRGWETRGGKKHIKK